MNDWSIPTRSAQGLNQEAISKLLDVSGAASPGKLMLDFFEQLARVDYVSMVLYGDSAPVLLEGHVKPGVGVNITHECFALYKDYFYKFDRVAALGSQMARNQFSETISAIRYQRDEIPDASWRERVYERQALSDRLSFLYTLSPGIVVGLNLYRTDQSQPFLLHELERLSDGLPLLRKAHLVSLQRSNARHERSQWISDAEMRLKITAPKITQRERQVCARIAAGLSADGIASELGVSPSTVTTLRKRAYMKLQIHSRIDLASLAT